MPRSSRQLKPPAAICATYSPDFNPIELAFAKLKTHLRGVGTRTLDPLIDAIGVGLARITAADIAGYYRHCGFTLPQPETQPS